MSRFSDKLADSGKIYDKAPLVTIEYGPRTTLLVDSDDRQSGNPFEFTVDLGYNLSRVRYVKLKKVIMPKLNNVNAGNNTFVIKHQLGTTGTITLTPGMYNTTTIANELTAQINAEFTLAGIADSVSVSFNTIQRTFTITSVGGNNMFIVDTSLLIQFGKILIPFNSEPLANVPSTTTILSGASAMLPTRYIIVNSDALCRHQMGRSISTVTTKPSNILGIIDVSDVYSETDFDISIPFKGIYKTILVDGGEIPVINSSNEMSRNLDFSLLDGFGRRLTNLFNLSAPFPSETRLSVVMIFELIF